MEFLGELERAFASFIYPNRVLIAVVALLAAAALGIVAWRRRWDLAAKRRPVRTVVLAAAAAVVLWTDRLVPRVTPLPLHYGR